MVWKPAIAALAAAGVVLYSVAFMQVDLSNRLASWVQAIGSIAAIYGAYAIGRQQRESDKQIAQDLAAEEARNLLQVVKAIADDVFNRYWTYARCSTRRRFRDQRPLYPSCRWVCTTTRRLTVLPSGVSKQCLCLNCAGRALRRTSFRFRMPRPNWRHGSIPRGELLLAPGWPGTNPCRMKDCERTSCRSWMTPHATTAGLSTQSGARQ